MPDRRRRRARQRRRVVGVGVLAVAGTGLGLGVSAATASGSTAYRTATASVSSVSRTLGVSATVEPVTQATASFQVSGTVATVAVKKGQQVTAGQTIATLDTTSLQASLTAAQQTLASAQAKLTEDELNESSSSSSSSSSSTGTGNANLTSIVLTAATKPTTTSLSTAQSAVVDDKHAVDTDLEAAAAALAAMQTACASGTTTSDTTSTTTSTTTPSSTSSTASTTPTTSTTVPSTSAACATALTTASTAEQKVSTDQNALAQAETTLANLLAQQAKQSQPSQQSTTPTTTPTSAPTTRTSAPSTRTTPSSSSNSSTGTSRSSSSSSSSSGSTTVNTDTPQQLASDEATIDSDKATVVEAQQSLAAATLVSPVSGTVESVGLAAGDTVSAGSSSDGITIVDWKTYDATATLTTSQVSDVKVGQQAQVTVDGTSGTLTATVTRVGPVQESNSSYTYPVVATITGATPELASGSAAQLVIDLSRADGTLVVPTSAVHTTSTGSYVYLDRDGSEVRQTVTIGLVGDIDTQITSGLAQGDVVILADPSQAVPSSSTNSSTRANRFAGVGPPGVVTLR